LEYDIKDRTAVFGIQVVKLIKKFPKTTIGLIIGRQLLRSGTSIGANCEEADAASSRKDFFHKISTCLKEAKETKYWLDITLKAEIFYKSEEVEFAKQLYRESIELSKIFGSIGRKKDNKNVSSGSEAHIV